MGRGALPRSAKVMGSLEGAAGGGRGRASGGWVAAPEVGAVGRNLKRLYYYQLAVRQVLQVRQGRVKGEGSWVGAVGRRRGRSMRGMRNGALGHVNFAPFLHPLNTI
jgi:hypothetical protein